MRESVARYAYPDTYKYQCVTRGYMLTSRVALEKIWTSRVLARVALEKYGRRVALKKNGRRRVASKKYGRRA